MIGFAGLFTGKSGKAQATNGKTADLTWAKSKLKKLSLEEKVGQMFMVRVAMPPFVNIKSPEFTKWVDEIKQYHVGSILLTVPVDGAILIKSEPYEAAALRDEVLEEALRQILGSNVPEAAIHKMAKP